MNESRNGDRQRTVRVSALRLRVGRNPYTDTHLCAHCRQRFRRGGLWLRLELGGTVVDAPLCEDCLAAGDLYESVVTFEADRRSHPLGRA